MYVHKRKLLDTQNSRYRVWTKSISNDLITLYGEWTGITFNAKLNNAWNVTDFRRRHFTIVTNPVAYII